MSKVKSKFTLHTEYKDFVPGQRPHELPIEVLSPHLISSSGCLMSVLAAAIMLVFGLCMGLAGLGLVFVDQQYVREGQPVTAIVTSCQIQNKKKLSRQISISYTYTVSDESYEGNDLISGNCDDHPVGKTLDTLYLASDITSSRIVQAEIEHIGIVVVAGGLLCIAALPLYLSWIMLREVSRYRYALRHHAQLARGNTLLEGEIRTINGYNLNNLGVYHVRVWYTFETPRKKILKGYAEAHRQDLKGKDLPPVGTPVTVLYADDGSHMML